MSRHQPNASLQKGAVPCPPDVLMGPDGITNPYEVMRQRNCKAAKFSKQEKYPTIQPPVSKCDPDLPMNWVKASLEEENYCRAINNQAEGVLQMYKLSANKTAARYYGVGDALELPEAIHFNRTLTRSMCYANGLKCSRSPKRLKLPPPPPPKPPQPAPVCRPYVLNRQALQTELQRIPIVRRQLSPKTAFDTLFCDKSVDPQDPFGVEEVTNKLVSLDEALDMVKPEKPPKHGLRRKHWYCPGECGDVENQCTAYEWAKYKLDPKPYQEEFHQWYSQQLNQPDREKEREPHDYDELYERFLACFEVKCEPDAECMAIVMCCPDKTEEISDDGGPGGAGGDGGGGAGGEAEEEEGGGAGGGGGGGGGGDGHGGGKGPKGPGGPVKPGTGEDSKKEDDVGEEKNKDEDKGKGKGKDKGKKKDKDENVPIIDENKDKDKHKDTKEKDKGSGKNTKPVPPAKKPKPEKNPFEDDPETDRNRSFMSDIVEDVKGDSSDIFKPMPPKPISEMPKPQKPKKSKRPKKPKGPKPPASTEDKGKDQDKCPPCPPPGCECCICDCLYVKKEKDSPLMLCLMRQEKTRQLREYLRIMRHREYIACREPVYPVCQHRTDEIQCDDCFCKDPKLAEYCDCLGSLQLLQKLLGKRRNPIVNNELLFNLQDLRSRLAKQMCACI